MKKNMLIVVVATFLVVACSLVDNGPSNQEADAIFQDYFQKHIPLKWAGSMMGGKLKTITISNLKRGKSIKSQNGGKLPESHQSQCKDCWPVEMHVKGEAMANMIFRAELHKFEDDANFWLCKTYEDKWLIDTRGEMTTGM